MNSPVTNRVTRRRSDRSRSRSSAVPLFVAPPSKVRAIRSPASPTRCRTGGAGRPAGAISTSSGSWLGSGRGVGSADALAVGRGDVRVVLREVAQQVAADVGLAGGAERLGKSAQMNPVEPRQALVEQRPECFQHRAQATRGNAGTMHIVDASLVQRRQRRRDTPLLFADGGLETGAAGGDRGLGARLGIPFAGCHAVGRRFSWVGSSTIARSERMDRCASSGCRRGASRSSR